MGKQIKPVEGNVVREWLRKKGEVVGTRGRLSAEAIEAFNKAHRRSGKTYTEPRLRETVEA